MAQRPIDLYYWPTPNGHKISIMLEECGLPYDIKPVNIGNGDQFKPEYLKLNPNAVVPTLVHDGDVFIESGVINAAVQPYVGATPYVRLGNQPLILGRACHRLMGNLQKAVAFGLVADLA